MHVTSLPGGHGIGDLGPEARKFVDFLARGGQRVWQILPLCPTAQGNSPYSSYSAFAGNPLLISLEDLVSDGWLRELPEAFPESDPTRVDFRLVREYKQQAFQSAFTDSRSRLEGDPDFQAFCQQQDWLVDFSLFEAVALERKELNWTRWPDGLRVRDSDALKQFGEQFADRILFSRFLQFVFHQQWNRLKESSSRRGVAIYGDLPIFVAHESVDVWANQEQYHLLPNGRPQVVAGGPPDYFSPTGQKWGNPLYRWNEMELDGYRWWVNRLRRAMAQYDLVRVDHFRGFEAYWEIPGDAPNAVSGSWKKGPQEAPFLAASQELGELPIIAEDLGLITREVHQLRDRLGFPPMRVLQFGFDGKEDNLHFPPNYPEFSVAYTGTHDNDTLVGWYQEMLKSATGAELAALQSIVNESANPHIELMESVMDSRSRLAVIPLQDLLGLDNGARMNLPATVGGNWQWRAVGTQLVDSSAEQLFRITSCSGRHHPLA